VHALTGGNPFYVAEIAAHPDEELPGSVRDAILASTTGLSAEDLEILQTIAAAPDGLDDRLLPALGIDIPVLRRLEATSLLSRVRHGVSFRHELARIAISEAAPPGAASALHARLLAALETIRSRDYAVLTHHAEAAADAVATARYARLAAEEAARSGAHTEAAAFLTLALTFPAAPADRAEMLERLSTEQYMVSRLRESVDSIIEAVQLRDRLGDAGGAAIAHDRRAIIEYYSAHRADAERHAQLATEAAEGTPVISTAQTTRAYLAYRRHDLKAARRLGDQARQAAEATADAASHLRLDIAEAASDLVEGDVTGRNRLLASATTAIRASLDEIGTTAYSNLSAIDVENRRLKDAEAVLGDSIPLTIELDIPICRQWQTGVRSRLHLLRGRWVAATEDATAVLREHGAPLAVIWPHLVLAQLGIRGGSDVHELDEHIDLAWELAQSLNESLLILAALSVIAERSWHGGVLDERLEDAQQIMDTASALPGTEWAVGDLAVWLTRLAIPVPIGTERLPEPHRLELQGAHRQAAEAWRVLGLPFDAALTGVHAQDIDTAIAAMAALTELDVPATTARARVLLAARGLGALPRPRRATTRANPSGLTNRQLEVARLVAQGFTNAELAARLYISPKTADHHVSAVLTKLGLSSRRDIVRRSAAFGLD
jgi:DNA-binding CsgD family transcriptional regulator